MSNAEIDQWANRMASLACMKLIDTLGPQWLGSDPDADAKKKAFYNLVLSFQRRAGLIPEPESNFSCGEDCQMCSGEYCDKHGFHPCECDVMDRHGDIECP